MKVDGYMGLFLSKVDMKMIHMVGQWRSDTLLIYLHNTAIYLMQGLTKTIMLHGDYKLTNPLVT